MQWIHWALLSAVLAAATALLSKIGVANVDSNTATAVRTAVVLAVSTAIVIATQGLGALRSVPQSAWLPLVASGIATGLSWLCYFRALKLGPASKVAPVDKLSVVFVVIFAAVFLHEAMTARSIAGVALITAGVLLLAK
jgi:transporter family protein